MAEFYFLLVEDNEDLVTLVLRIFRKHRLATKLNVVHNGQEALDFLQYSVRQQTSDHRSLPALILLDLQMPVMDGIETLKNIKQDQHVKQIPVVVLTTSKDPGDIRTCYELGANGYVEKSTNYEDLEATMLVLENYWSKINVPPLLGVR